MSEIKWLIDQTGEFAERQAQNAITEIRNETSLVNAAARKADELRREMGQSPQKSGVYVGDKRYDVKQTIATNSVYKTARSVPDVKVAPPVKRSEGYTRVLPEQVTLTDPNYGKNIALKTMGFVFIAAAVGIAAYLLMKYTFLLPI